MKIWTPQEASEGPDLTPMIDVVFLLIVFFMAVAQVLSDEKIKVSIPLADHAQIPEEAGRQETLSLKHNGSLFAGTRAIDLEELSVLVQKNNTIIKDYRVYLRVDKHTPHKYVRQVMQACSKAGVFDIVFAAYQGED